MIARLGWTLVATVAAMAMTGCGDAPRGDGVRDARSSVADAGTSAPAIVFLGTSLTAGYGLPSPDQAYPALIQQKLDSAGLQYRVVNAGVSGETSADARRRIDWVLRQPAAVLVVETGANDGLRGLDPDSLRANIQAIMDRAKAHRPAPQIVLIGMRTLPNYGAAYGERFAAVYPAIAKANDVPLVPFLLAGVGGHAGLNQPDGVHPTAAGQRVLAENVWKVLEPVLRQPR